MATEYVVGVVGRDNKNPIREIEQKFKTYAIHEIFLGGDADGKFIPYAGDIVYDIPNRKQYAVEDVPLSGIAVLVPLCFESCTEQDLITEVIPGYETEVYRVYTNANVYPHILAVDAGWVCGGSTLHVAKVFLGNRLDDESTVISKSYDQQQRLTDTALAMETVAIDGMNNIALKTVAPGYTTTRLKDGEVVTVAVYDHEGHVRRSKMMRVVNTALFHNAIIGVREVLDIELVSAMIRPGMPYVLNLPMHTLTSTLNLMARIHWSDGEVSEPVPVDGNRLSLLGFDALTTSIAGEERELLLMYKLAENEITLDSNLQGNRHHTRRYTARVSEPFNSYNVRLYACPEWVSQESGYRLRWWLLSRDTGFYADVTEHVHYDELTAMAFNGKAFNTTQVLKVAVPLSEVSATFIPHVHVQEVKIKLINPPMVGNLQWEIISRKTYGERLRAKVRSAHNGIINLYYGFESPYAWLKALYHDTDVLTQFLGEEEILTPTHVTVIYGQRTVVVPINNIQQDITLGTAITPGTTVQLVFTIINNGQTTPINTVALTLTP